MIVSGPRLAEKAIPGKRAVRFGLSNPRSGFEGEQLSTQRLRKDEGEVMALNCVGYHT
jgi:hypothetical protein